MNKALVMVAAGLGAFWLWSKQSKAGSSIKISASGGATMGSTSVGGTSTGSTSVGGASAAVIAGYLAKKRDLGEVDYRVRYAAATTSKERSLIRENEKRTAQNTLTGVASDESVQGIPVPYVTGAMKPAATSQPALMALARYIRAGFKFDSESARLYAMNNYASYFEDWRDRFHMPLTWL